MRFIRWSSRGLVLAVLSFSVPAYAQASEADIEEARRLYGEATEAFKDGRHREAALAFEKASRLKPHAVALYTAAQAWEAAGEKARAADAYSQALSTPKLSDAQAERARERLAALSQEVGTVVIVGDGARAQMDDHNESRVPARLHGDPGEHSVLILRDDGSVVRRKVKLEAGESVEIDAAEAPEAAPEEAEAGETVELAEPRKKGVSAEADSSQVSPSVWKTVGWATAGAGVAALGGAALFGITANGAEDTYKGSPTRDTLDHAKTVETRTNVMLAVGGVLTAAGVGILVWQMTSEQKKEAASVRLGPRGVWATGQF